MEESYIKILLLKELFPEIYESLSLTTFISSNKNISLEKTFTYQIITYNNLHKHIYTNHDVKFVKKNIIDVQLINNDNNNANNISLCINKMTGKNIDKLEFPNILTYDSHITVVENIYKYNFNKKVYKLCHIIEKDTKIEYINLYDIHNNHIEKIIENLFEQ